MFIRYLFQKVIFLLSYGIYGIHKYNSLIFIQIRFIQLNYVFCLVYDLMQFNLFLVSF